MIDDERYNTKQATFDPVRREEAIRIFEQKVAQLDGDELLKKLEEADIIASKLGHFSDNHRSEQALVNGFMAPITYPNGDAITLAQPPVRMGCLEPSQAEHARPIGADNDKVFQAFGIE